MTLFYFIIIIYLLLLIVIFILGYILGKLSSNNGVSNTIHKKQKHSINDQLINTIDDTKFVVKIKTEELEKKYTELGETRNSEDNITNSVSKLKNMKG